MDTRTGARTHYLSFVSYLHTIYIMKRDDLNKNYEKKFNKTSLRYSSNYYKIIAEEYVAIYSYRSVMVKKGFLQHHNDFDETMITGGLTCFKSLFNNWRYNENFILQKMREAV